MMLLRCIRSENLKLRHSLIFPACILIPVIPAVMGTFNYLQNTGLLTEQWYSLWTQHTLFYASFFYAPLIALYCSYLWRLEHLNHNWNVFLTAPVTIPCLYLGKLAVIMKVTLITQLWVGTLYLFSGKIIGLPGQNLLLASPGNPGCRRNRHRPASVIHVNTKLFPSHRYCPDWQYSWHAAL